MQGLCLADYTSHLPGTQLHVIGELRLKQHGPLPVSMRVSPPPILPSTYTTVEQSHLSSICIIVACYRLCWLFEYILLENMRRNVTTECTPSLVWTSGVGTSFSIHLALRIPAVERVSYSAPVYETLKFAWIQYLGVFAIVWAVLNFLQWLVFSLHLLPSFVVCDGVPPPPLFKKLS